MASKAIYTVNRYLAAVRKRIVRYYESESPVSGEIAVDERCFNARRGREIKIRGAQDNAIPVFSFFKSNGRLYRIAPDCSNITLQDILRGHVDLESVIHANGYAIMTA